MSTGPEKSHIVVVVVAASDGEGVGNQDSASPVKEQRSSVPECSDAAAAAPDPTGSGSGKPERDCRICHLSVDAADRDPDNDLIELGCSCKEDLGAAHRQCAEAWFKIRRSKTCEICGSIARNVPGDYEAESGRADEATAQPQLPMQLSTGPPNFWQGHRFLNFVLACVIFAFVFSWFFHFHVPS